MMTRQWDFIGEGRAACTPRQPENAKGSVNTGTAGVFIRVALAVVFLYLTVVSYLVLGVAGPVFISILFVIALLVPYFYQVIKNLMDRPRVTKDDRVLTRKPPQEGKIRVHP